MKRPILLFLLSTIAAYAAVNFLKQPLQEFSTTKTQPLLGESKSITTDGQISGKQLAQEAATYQDEIMRAAVAEPSLEQAVKLIMDRQEEDHCGDTRLVCLIESLPKERLAEIGPLLAKFASDPYVTTWVMRTWAQRDPAAAPRLHGTGWLPSRKIAKAGNYGPLF
jgi:hypothetical protein